MTPMPPPQPTTVLCVQCRYNLTGVAIGGTCPECGVPVTPAFQRQASSGASTHATASMALGLASVVGVMSCALISAVCGPLALYYYRKAKADLDAGIAPPNSHGMATTGLVCGIIGTILGAIAMLITLFYVAFFIIAIVGGM